MAKMTSFLPSFYHKQTHKTCHLSVFDILFVSSTPLPSNASRPPTYAPGDQNPKMPTTSTLLSRARTLTKKVIPPIPRTFLNRLRPTSHLKIPPQLRRYLPRPTFLLLHWTYIITICMVSSVIFWHFSTPRGHVSYIDSLFLIVAATTQAGMSTINLSDLNTFQQCMLFFHIILGNPIVISAFVVHVRKRAFHTRFKKAAVEKEKTRHTTPGEQPVFWQSSFVKNTEPGLHPRQTLHCASSKSSTSY